MCSCSQVPPAHQLPVPPIHPVALDPAHCTGLPAPVALWGGTLPLVRMGVGLEGKVYSDLLGSGSC